MHGGGHASPNEKLLRACGWIGLAGCLGVIAGNVAGILIYERHDWISETISALAAGRWGWIQDVGLVLFALALAACGIGLERWGLGSPAPRRTVATVLGLLTIDVLLIALHNEYGDRDSGKFVIHSGLVYILGALVAVAMLVAAGPLRQCGEAWRHFSLGAGIAWVVAAPVYFVVPTGWDGLYERVVGLLFVAWVAAIAWLLLHRGRRPLRRP